MQKNFSAEELFSKINLSTAHGKFLEQENAPPLDPDSFARGYIAALHDLQPAFLSIAHEIDEIKARGFATLMVGMLCGTIGTAVTIGIALAIVL